MDTSTAPSYQGCRFPVEIIAHCVWLYFRFCLSFRDVQEMMLERGVEVSHEGIRLWTLKFGSDYARGLWRGGHGFGDIWHLDEVFSRVTFSLLGQPVEPLTVTSGVMTLPFTMPSQSTCTAADVCGAVPRLTTPGVPVGTELLPL